MSRTHGLALFRTLVHLECSLWSTRVLDYISMQPASVMTTVTKSGTIYEDLNVWVSVAIGAEILEVGWTLQSCFQRHIHNNYCQHYRKRELPKEYFKMLIFNGPVSKSQCIIFHHLFFIRKFTIILQNCNFLNEIIEDCNCLFLVSL